MLVGSVASAGTSGLKVLGALVGHLSALQLLKLKLLGLLCARNVQQATDQTQILRLWALTLRHSNRLLLRFLFIRMPSPLQLFLRTYQSCVATQFRSAEAIFHKISTNDAGAGASLKIALYGLRPRKRFFLCSSSH